MGNWLGSVKVDSIAMCIRTYKFVYIWLLDTLHLCIDFNSHYIRALKWPFDTKDVEQGYRINAKDHVYCYPGVTD